MEILPHEPDGEDYVPFLAKGAPATGEYQCASCGYGINLHSYLPRCPMCGGEAWEQVSWSPFTRAAELQS
jgi:rubredoxin